jgi:hypothetical protein
MKTCTNQYSAHHEITISVSILQVDEVIGVLNMTFANSRFRKANGHSKFTLAGSYKFNSVGTAFSLTMRIKQVSSW